MKVQKNRDYTGPRIQIDYRDSDLFDFWHYIHKYYLSPADKGALFPVDIQALDVLSDDRREFGIKEAFDLWDGVILGNLPDVTLYYRDLKLEKRLDADLVRRGLIAIAAYRREIMRKLTAEEERAALNLNEWLCGYEKGLVVGYIEIENGMKAELRRTDSLLVDFEMDLEMQFYLRQDDPFYDNDAADEHDWERDAALMCELKHLTIPHRLNEIHDPEYFGLGDDRDHNETRGRGCSDPVVQARQCYLFHMLTSHCGVPRSHLKRIGTIWSDIRVINQTAVTIDLTGENIVARQVATYPGKIL